MWTEKDSLNLREFLATQTGQNLKEEFDSTEPKIKGSTLEERAMDATAYQQWKDDRSFIKSLLSFKETSTPEVTTVDTSKLD